MASGAYIRRPVEDAVIRIQDRREKLAKKYPQPEKQMRQIERALRKKRRGQLTVYERTLLDRYFEIYLALYPDYEGAYYNCP